MRYFRNRAAQENIYECIEDCLVLENGRPGRCTHDAEFNTYFQEVFPTLKTPIIPLYFDGDEKEYLKKQRRFIKDNLRFNHMDSNKFLSMDDEGLVTFNGNSVNCNSDKFLDYFTPHIINDLIVVKTNSETHTLSNTNQDKGKKETNGKLSYELYPEFITMMAERMEQSDKYPPYNWKKPIDKNEIIKAIVRHTMDIWKGKFDDDGREFGGIEALATNAMILAYQLKEVSDE